MADKREPPPPDVEATPTPTPEDVPDVVLEELLAAFSDGEVDAIDFDDPAIDRMLGLGDDAEGTVDESVDSTVDSTAESADSERDRLDHLRGRR